MAESYCKGDYVRYSCSGVCLVEDIRQDSPTGKGASKEFYILKPISNPGSTIFVPTNSDALVAKMARLPSQSELEQLILSLKEEDLPWITDRKLRAATFQAMVKTCDLGELLQLARCIHRQQQILLARGKKLSSSDESVLHRAEGLIQNELSFILQITGDQVGSYVHTMLNPQ